MVGKRVMMGMTYFKRYRMEIPLDRDFAAAIRLPAGYCLVPWSEELLEAHAEAKYRSFAYEIDANVFPCLGEYEGCLRLMREITRRDTFMPEATWLLQYQDDPENDPQVCGTIQGSENRQGWGAIQNVGVVPEHRGLGLGTCLVYAALNGFGARRLPTAMLEVTTQNCGALRLYERLGFYRTKTVYKVADVAYA